MATRRKASGDRLIFGAPVWLWKTLGTALVGLLLKSVWDFGAYTFWVGQQLKVQDQKFSTYSTMLQDQRYSRDRDIQDLKDRTNQLQSQIDQIHQDMRAFHGHR